MNEAELCGRRVKSLFYDQKAAQTGRPYRPSSRWNNPETWLQVGQNCLTARADPVDFVRAAFKFNTVPGGPFPNQLVGDAARGWHAKLKESAAWSGQDKGKYSSVYVKELHQLIVQTMDHLMRMSAVMRRLQLRLPASNLTAWQRVLLSHLEPEVMRRHAAEAKRQLAANPALLSALEELGWGKQLEKLELWKQEN